MNCDEFEQLAALQALGVLEGPDAEALRARLARDPVAAAELSRFMAVATALTGSVQPARPPAGVRERVLQGIRGTPQLRPAASPSPATEKAPPAEAPLRPGFLVVRSDAPWSPGPLPGTRFKVLSAAPEQAHAMLMIELGPGAVYPEHDHLGVEDMFVLTGDLQSEGRALGPGDLIHAEGGTHHGELRSLGGCTAILVVPLESLAGQVTV